ncbi:MAG: hypothetical protein ACPLYF_01740 [Fervidobacterium sp.]
MAERGEVLKPIELEIQARLPAIFRQLIEAVDPLTMIREQLSNIFAKEVGATKVEIIHYYDPTYGYSFIFKDDGCGMDYTGNLEKPGRLDRFIHFGFSGIAGLKVDEFSWKGLGSKLSYNCRKLIVETWTGEGPGYRVEVHEPRKKFLKIPPEVPKPLLTVYDNPKDKFESKGTTIMVLGYDSGQRSYTFDKLKNYLLYRTVVGYTKPEQRKLPKVMLKVLGYEEVIEPGFPFIKKESRDDWRTVSLEPIIVVTETSKDGIPVTVTLKGGFTLDTGKFGLSPTRFNTGVILAVKGIPLFPLDFNNFRGNFQLMSKFCCLVAECDEMELCLNIDRSWYRKDAISEAFEDALSKAFRKIIELDDYKKMIHNMEEEERKRKGESLEQRKQSLLSKTQRYVFVEGVEGYIHKEPDNEYDTLAVLWKLEGMKKIPLNIFRTIEHTAIGGIDIIAELQEKPGDEVQKYVSVEVEHVFERFMLHRHSPSQTRYVFCWEIADPEALERTHLPYKYRKLVDDKVIEVYEIRKFPGISVKPLF